MNTLHAVIEGAGQSDRSVLEQGNSKEGLSGGGERYKTVEIPQYALGKILLIWAAAALPMGILGWVVAPALSAGSTQPGLVRLGVLTVGLAWQFVLVLILLYREAGTLRWSDAKQRLWLLKPSRARDGVPDGRLWWWLIPFLLVTVLYELRVSGALQHVWVSLFPALAEPPSFSMAGFLGSPEGRASLHGAWGFFWVFIAEALFNTILGEELLFRGLLLPRMAGVFGKWDWVANGLLFGFYHLHQPWAIISSVVDGIFLYAFPTRRFHSTWFGIILHSGQSVYISFLLLGLVLGLA